MPRENRIFSLVFPSFGNLLFLTLFLYLSLVKGQLLLVDGDTGYHIRVGEFILKQRSVPDHDPFSYHAPPIPWIAHEWLTESVMGWIYGWAGMTGVVIFFCFLIALVYWLLYKILRLEAGNILVAMIITVLAALASVSHWLARPHIVSLLMILVWSCLLDQYQYRNRNLLPCLPLILLFWVNLHGGFITGFVLIGIYLAGNLLSYFSAGQDRALRAQIRTKILHLLYALLACLAVSALNPFGYELLLFPFRLISEKFFMDNVHEFKSPNFHVPSIVLFEVYLLVFLAAIVSLRRRLHVIELGLVIFFLHMALYSGRYLPLFALITAPILNRHINRFLDDNREGFVEKLNRKAAAFARVDGSLKGALWPAAGILIVAVAMADGRLRWEFDPSRKPLAAVDFLKEQKIPGRMFNDDEFGDYLVYSAFPEYRVFIDGRLDMYGTERCRDYLDFINLRPRWEEIVTTYGFDWVFFRSESPLSMYLSQRDDWQLIYSDQVASVFLKDIPQNAALIEKFRKVKPAW